MSDAKLGRYVRRLSPDERGSVLDGQHPDGISEEPMLRADGSDIDLTVLDALMAEFVSRRASGQWNDDRATVDRWLSPRVHYALRLTRNLAADREMWEWLAVRYQDHTYWRWFDRNAVTVGENRWYGP